MKQGQDFVLWKNYLMDYWNDPDDFGELYLREVQWRVMLHLSSDEAADKFKERDALRGLYGSLRSGFVHRDFIWVKNMILIIPKPIYWFLYRKLLSR